MAPRARFELATLRLTAEAVKNLSAVSGVAYRKLGAIFVSLAAPNVAPKSRIRAICTELPHDIAEEDGRKVSNSFPAGKFPTRVRRRQEGFSVQALQNIRFYRILCACGYEGT
jgi:hypothetical protein